MMKWLWSALLALILVVSAAPAIAQSTGGSFGGGSFGGGGSGGSSGSSGSSGSWGGGSSSSRPRSTRPRREPSTTTSYGGTSSGGAEMGLGGFCCLLIFVGVIGLVIFAAKKKGAGSASGASAPTYRGPNAMHITRLSLGVDWRARRDLQARLKQLAETGDTQSPQGLANLLRETALALRRVEMSWLYVSHQRLGPLSPQNAEQQFRAMTSNARASFQHEVVRGADGQVLQQNAPEMQAHRNEGEGMVVVHLFLATRRPVQTPSSIDAAEVRAALTDCAALTPQQLAVLEVVWSPAEENDRMSSAELEQNYPEMQLIDPNSIAGRIFCTYCSGPFAMELLSCPHCGAPAEASRDNRAPRRPV